MRGGAGAGTARFARVAVAVVVLLAARVALGAVRVFAAGFSAVLARWAAVGAATEGLSGETGRARFDLIGDGKPDLNGDCGIARVLLDFGERT